VSSDCEGNCAVLVLFAFFSFSSFRHKPMPTPLLLLLLIFSLGGSDDLLIFGFNASWYVVPTISYSSSSSDGTALPNRCSLSRLG
jgi:hypothetical protein